MKKLFTCIIFMGISLMSAKGQNPYLPLWEYIPDGEPYVFEDPDNAGKYRVYIYGSHDVLKTEYCGRDQVVWSAPVEDLTRWRYDGVILESKKDANGNDLNENGIGDVLYAPDVVEMKNANGEKEYYLYPNNQAWGRNGMVAKSKRPDGPFEVCNWDKDDPRKSEGVLSFDPAVFVDDDGKVYGYWGFQRSYGAELDPETMSTVKPGTEIVEDMVSSNRQEGIFRFFEASSIRKIKDKYVFIYSRWSENGEFGMYGTNYTLAYAYSNNPLGPFTYGGTIIDGRGRDTDENGKAIYTAHPGGNTHGSICEVNGQWYVFYHRQCGTNQYSRQAMVAPINVEVTEGPNGKVVISEGEYTSEGFYLNGLDPMNRYSAGIACYYTGPDGAKDPFPNFIFTGSYPEPRYADYDGKSNPYNLKINHNPMVNNTDGSIVGYKYFNLDKLKGKTTLKLVLELVSKNIEGSIDVMVDSPWVSKGGKRVGTVTLKAENTNKTRKYKVDVSGLVGMTGKHAIYLCFHSDVKEKSICDLHYLRFK